MIPKNRQTFFLILEIGTGTSVSRLINLAAPLSPAGERAACGCTEFCGQRMNIGVWSGVSGYCHDLTFVK